MTLDIYTRHLSSLLAAISTDQIDVQNILKIVGNMAAHILDIHFVTISSFDETTGEAERLYSSRPMEYPVSGRKPVNQTWWSEWVMKQKRTFCANSSEEIAEVFYDHKEIFQLGCESIVNIPIVFKGSVIATINCLGKAGHFTEDRVKESELLKAPATLAFLALRTCRPPHSAVKLLHDQ
ncbi:GAF domain-containing protein [Gluconacetobacter sp. Hr-1-5]|uniref:GAF domain-containing protein n=1 Tax=Gluconacetobacter sp. Hr-1-5 TaxID=3395370 RepID=UPI003B52ACBB